MTRTIQLKPVAIVLLPLVISFLAFLPTTTVFQAAPSQLSWGILLDLLITVPFLYFIAIRKSNIPHFSLIYVLLGGIALAHVIIPAEHQQPLTKLTYIGLPILEAAIIGKVGYSMWVLNRSLRQVQEADFYDKLLTACQKVFPNRIGRVLATELAVAYYLFSRPKKQTKTGVEFTYYKKSGIKMIVAALLFLLVFETFVVHVLVAKWQTEVAWTLSLLGTYTMLQVMAILRSMNRRPILIDPESKKLILRYGFGCQATIPLSSIAKIEPYGDQVRPDKGHTFLSPFELIDSNNLTLYLSSQQTLHKVYGINKTFDSISFFIDEKEVFMEKLSSLR
ncbi:MAG: hypothetical protein AAGI38_06840 [Bacteroidota bacterium]